MFPNVKKSQKEIFPTVIISLFFIIKFLSLHQSKNRNFRTHHKANLKRMPQRTVDVKHSSIFKINFSGNIFSVFHGKQRRNDSGNSALSSMRMSAQNPTLITIPDIFITGIGIMTENDICLGRIIIFHHFLRCKIGRP